MNENDYTVKIIDAFFQMKRPAPKKDKRLHNVFIVMDYYENDLDTLLSSQSFELTNTFMKKVMTNILTGLRFIHEANIMHRDIKAQNILVNQEM